jgi:hypothetical protein
MAEVAAQPALRMHDALAINALGAVLVAPVVEEEEAADMIGALAAALPLVSRDGILMADLAKAAEALIAAWPAKGRAPIAWARAEFDARIALGQVLRWRAAAAAGKIWPGGAGRPA